MMQELLHKIGTENFTNKRLGELYLVGYADQMMDFKAENAEYKAKAKSRRNKRWLCCRIKSTLHL